MQSETITTEQLSDIVKAGQNGRFLKTYADELGVSYQFLSKVLKGLCGPGDQIAKSLGYEQISVFRKIPEGLLAAAKAGHKAIVDEATAPFTKATIKKALKALGKRNTTPAKKYYSKKAIKTLKKVLKIKTKKKPSKKPKKRATPRKAKK